MKHFLVGKQVERLAVAPQFASPRSKKLLMIFRQAAPQSLLAPVAVSGLNPTFVMNISNIGRNGRCFRRPCSPWSWCSGGRVGGQQGFA
ncbi:hypothetical protein [Sandarakinorhabdus sp.]|uniref:hypothetical protein n=1 Tax=Sandarakinorhabdus sp. TaxID=1916663 RepID=UPI0035683F46